MESQVDKVGEFVTFHKKRLYSLSKKYFPCESICMQVFIFRVMDTSFYIKILYNNWVGPGILKGNEIL